MAKKKSNTGMIIAIIVSVIVVGIVVWGFLTKWKFIDDGKSTEKAKAKAKAKKEVQKKIDAIINTPTDTKVVEVTPKMEEKSKEIEKKDEEKIKSMSEEEIKQKFAKAKEEAEKELNGFQIIEHMTDIPLKCEGFSEEEIRKTITKTLKLLKEYGLLLNINLKDATPKIIDYYRILCDAETLGETHDKADLCHKSLEYNLNPHTLKLYKKLDLIAPGGSLYPYRYWLFSDADKQKVDWSDEPESKEIRMLYKLYRYLKACPVVQAPSALPGACDDSKYTATDSYGDGCSYYEKYPGDCGYFDTENFKSENCCGCKN